MPGTLSPRGRAQLARDLEVDSVHPEAIGDLHRAEERRDTGVVVERVVRGEVDRLEDEPLHPREARTGQRAPTEIRGRHEHPPARDPAPPRPLDGHEATPPGGR